MVMSAEHRTKMCLSPLLGTTHINENFRVWRKSQNKQRNEHNFTDIFISLYLFLNELCMYVFSISCVFLFLNTVVL